MAWQDLRNKGQHAPTNGAQEMLTIMFSLRSKVVFPLLALVAVLAGCSAETGTSAGAGSSADEVATTVAASDTAPANGNSNGNANHFEGGNRRHFGGPESMLVGAALHSKDLNLTADQKTAIETAMKANRPAKPAFDASRAKTLANEIRTNTFDANVAKPEVNESAHAARIANQAKVLQTLHDTLTADQRVTLVNSINQREADHAKKMADMKANGSPEKGDKGEHVRGGEGHRGGGGDRGMLGNLNLTQEQKDTLKAKFEASRPAKPTDEQRAAMKAQFESMRTEMKSKLESFKSDSFNATAFVTPSKSITAIRPQGQGAHANRLAIITSVLTPAQREQLATRIEQGPQMKPVKPATTVTAPQINQ